MSTRCPDCHAEADHCHGTLVRHADGTVECTDPTCDELGVGRHDLVVVCAVTDDEAQPDGCSCVVVTLESETHH